MIKIFCDRCKKEITDENLGYIAVNIKDQTSGDLLEDNEFEASHFCLGCTEKIRKFVREAVESKQTASKAEKNRREEHIMNKKDLEEYQKIGLRISAPKDRIDHLEEMAEPYEHGVVKGSATDFPYQQKHFHVSGYNIRQGVKRCRKI